MSCPTIVMPQRGAVSTLNQTGSGKERGSLSTNWDRPVENQSVRKILISLISSTCVQIQSEITRNSLIKLLCIPIARLLHYVHILALHCDNGFLHTYLQLCEVLSRRGYEPPGQSCYNRATTLAVEEFWQFCQRWEGFGFSSILAVMDNQIHKAMDRLVCSQSNIKITFIFVPNTFCLSLFQLYDMQSWLYSVFLKVFIRSYVFIYCQCGCLLTMPRALYENVTFFSFFLVWCCILIS